MNQDAIAALITKQYPGLLSLLRRKLRDDQLARDALNNALVTSLEHVRAGRVANPSLIAGYVFQVAMNQVRNLRRKMDERTGGRADPETIESLPDSRAETYEAFDSAMAARLRSMVESLPAIRDREVIKRFYLDEEEKESICRDLGLSALHFDKVIFRARQRMRTLLEEQGFRKPDFFSVLLCLG